MKKGIRSLLMIVALAVILISGFEIAESAGWREIQTVSSGTAGAMETQKGEISMDIAVWELLMIGGGYLAWAAAAWDWKQEHGYRGMGKREYAAQE